MSRVYRSWTVPAVLVLLTVVTPTAQGEDEGTGPKGVFAFFQGIIHGRMAPHENPRDLTLIPFMRLKIEESGAERIVTQVPPGCGMTQLQPLPREEAIEHLHALFALYGYATRPDHDVTEAGARARLDGYDPKTKTGFVLVRGAFQPRGRHDPVLRERPPLRESHELSLAEWRGLQRRGYRILRVPEDRFVGLPPSTLVPLLACLLDAADWLNGITDGEDLDVGALLADPRAVRIPGIVEKGLPLAQPIQQDDNGIFIVVKTAATTHVQLGALAAKAPERRSPGLLVLPFSWLPPYQAPGYDFSSGDLEFILMQQTTPTQHLRVRSGRPVFLLPPTFDLTKPFRIQFALPTGAISLSREVTVRAAP
jgi:hypothetical protein